MKIFPSITTTNSSRWKTQIGEIGELGLREVCFFPTVLRQEERKEASCILEKTGLRAIPLVHIRSDMTSGELDYFIKRFKTEVFNIHSQSKDKLVHDISSYKDLIYIENHHTPMNDKEISQYAGICLDTAHAEDIRLLRKEDYPSFMDSLSRCRCGCWHVSAVKKDPLQSPTDGNLIYSWHKYDDLSEFDYIERYKKFLPEIIALELENTLKEQLKAKAYIEKLLSG